MNETKPKRRWFRFSIRDLLLLTVIVALTTGWWLDHRQLRAIISSFESPEVPEYLVELNLSKDEEIAMLNRSISTLENTYDNAKADNDDKAADTAKTQIDKLKMRKQFRSDELRPPGKSGPRVPPGSVRPTGRAHNPWVRSRLGRADPRGSPAQSPGVWRAAGALRVGSPRCEVRPQHGGQSDGMPPASWPRKACLNTSKCFTIGKDDTQRSITKPHTNMN
jgi:hypothetical protein